MVFKPEYGAVSAALSLFALAGTAHAQQWVSFTDEASSRLLLTEVGMSDSMEKDIAVGDFNRDGWTDAIVVRKQPFSVAGPRADVLLMNENGVLVDRTATLAPEFLTNLTDARDIRVADLDNDGWDDLIIANTFFQMPSVYMNLGNDAQGQWRGFANESNRISSLPSTSTIKFCAVWTGDIDNDGDLDAYFSNYQSDNDVLIINDGSGFFTDETDARMGSLANVAFGTSNEIQDVDNDGDMDIIRISTLGGPGVQIFFNNGDGTFTASQNPPDNAAYHFVTGDFNSDGLLDMYIVQDPQDRVNLAVSATPDSNVQYNSVTMTSPRTTGFGGNTHVADIDNDGDLDIGVAPIDVDIANCGPNPDLALLQNPGNGVFFDPWPAADDQNFHVPAHDFEFIDVNNDGCLDIFAGLCTGWRLLIQNDCAVAGNPADLNGDGVVNGADLAALLSNWGQAGSADLNNDGVTNGADLAQLLSSWG